MTDDPQIAARDSPDNQRYRNPNPRPSGGPCPTCNNIRPGGWKGPCRHCLDARAPRTAAVRRAAQRKKDSD